MRTFWLRDIEIDPSRGEIRRGEQVVPAETKVRRLVFLLVEADGRLVSHDDVLAALWPGVRVSRDALYRIVKEARAVLGDDGRRQAVIRTLPGQGLRWVAPVEVREDAHSGIGRPTLEAIEDLYTSGRIAEARSQALQLARLTPVAENAPQRARALVWASDLMLHGRVDREWLTLTNETLEALEAGDAPLRAALLSRQAYQLYWSRNPGKSRAAIRAARALAEKAGAVEVLAWVELIEHMQCEGPERAEERRRHAERAVEHARRGGVAQTELWAREQVAHDAMEAADLAAVESEADAIGLLAEEHSLVWSARVRTLLLLHRGDLPAAERAILREIARFPEGGQHVFQYLGGPLLWLRHEQGRLAEILPLLRQFVAAGGELPVWRAALARAELETGALAEARAEYEGLAAGGFRDIDGDFVSAVTLAHLAELCCAFGDAARVGWIEDHLAPFSGRLIVSPRASFCMGPTDLLLGRLAAQAGRLDEARSLLERALALCQRVESRPAEERTTKALATLEDR